MFENPNIGWRQSLVPSLRSKNKALAKPLRNMQKQVSKFSVPVRICLNRSIVGNIGKAFTKLAKFTKTIAKM